MRTSLDKNPHDVKSMFNAVAEHYDLMNFLASLGQKKFWRQATRHAAVARPGMRVLSATTGTGANAIEFVHAGAGMVAVDFSQDMVHEGQIRHPKLDFQQADAVNLKFTDSSFDTVTVSFGLRSVADPDQALREFYRVLRPDGHLMMYEFSRPTQTPFRTLYRFSLGTVLPPIARLASNDAMTYDYLTESTSAWPSQYQFATHLRDADFEHLQLRNLTGDIVALHRDYKFK